MTRQELVQKLNADLTDVIGTWLDHVIDVDENAAEEIGWVGDDLKRLMAVAAVNVLEASIDVQEVMEENGVVQ